MVFGAVAIALPLASIAAAMLASPWFSSMRGAFSDLGAEAVNDPWIFD